MKKWKIGAIIGAMSGLMISYLPLLWRLFNFSWVDSDYGEED
jgi:hypothetical protein